MDRRWTRRELLALSAMAGSLAWMPRGEGANMASGEGKRIHFTRKGDAVYVLCLDWPGKELVLSAPKQSGPVTATLLGSPTPLKHRFQGSKLMIEMPAFGPDAAPCRHAYVVRLTGVS